MIPQAQEANHNSTKASEIEHLLLNSLGLRRHLQLKVNLLECKLS